MSSSTVFEVLAGDKAVEGYEKYAQTPHGRLRHDLLFRYYDAFVRERPIEWVFDVGGGSGFLLKGLLEAHPKLHVALMDWDDAMIRQAKTNLAAVDGSERAQFIQGSIDEFPGVFPDWSRGRGPGLIAFNHAIEYVPDQIRALTALAQATPKASFLGIMYLNNSHEALRYLLHKDSIAGLRNQLADPRVDMAHFGKARTMDGDVLVHCLRDQGLTLVTEYGMRCVAELKSKDFVDQNYDELLALEFDLGALPDFMGLARYRLKFFAAGA